MKPNLTNSYCDRQKILHYPYLLQVIDLHLNLDENFGERIIYRDDLVFTKQQIQCLFNDVDINAIDRCIATNKQELEVNGYTLLKNEELKNFLLSSDIRTIKQNIRNYEFRDREFAISTLELFTFKALLNIIMLLSKSKKAKFVRSRVLSLFIDTVAEAEGDRIKYIGRSIEYLSSLVKNYIYSCSNALHDAVDKYFELSNGFDEGHEYCLFTLQYEKIYKLIFGDKYYEYGEILEFNNHRHQRERIKHKNEARYQNPLNEQDRLRTSLYTEIKDIIGGLEDYIAHQMQLLFEQKKRKITVRELDEIISSLEDDPDVKPSIEECRIKMGWRSLTFEDALNRKLKAHNKLVDRTDLNEFIEAKNTILKEKLMVTKNIAVFQRLNNS